MIETLISIVTSRIGELLLSKAQLKFSGEILSQFDDARNDLRQIRCFLKEAEKRARNGDAVFQDHVSEIRESAYDLEDAIATFILKEVCRRSKLSDSVFPVLRLTNKIYSRFELHKVSSEIEKISNKISKSRLRFQENRLIPSGEWDNSGSSSTRKEKRELMRRSYSHTVEDDIVGFEKHIRTLTDILLDKNVVVSLYGMGGLGKTTLARKIYQSGAIHRHFEGRAWVSVSQQCQERDIWEGVYVKLSSPSADERREIREMGDQEIAKRLYDLLKSKRCLVVLDDIWSISKWRLLKAAFPITRSSKSTILLTTRNRNVAYCAGFTYTSGYQLECLDEETSWELFEKKLHFGRNIAMANPEDIGNMQRLGRMMLKHCAGLPLAIVLLSGVLSSKESLLDWEMLRNNFKTSKSKAKLLLNEDDGLSSILGLSYDELPNHLKLCFLYLAQFPNNYEIAVKDLCWLWVAEGFVSSEDLAYQCLDELVERSMVQVLKWGSVPGRIKTCTIHDLMRDLCLVNAEKENFLQTIDFRSKDGEKYSSLASDSMQKHKDRRLAVYLDGANSELLPSIKSRDASLRSLLCFNSAEGESYKKVMELVLKKFHLLRVLRFDNGDSCYVGKLPKGIGKLIHLRLLSLKDADVGELPSSIGNLGCLQNLDLRVSHKGRVKLPNVFWKLRQLGHLYLPLSYEVRKGKLRLDNLTNLKTLVNIELESCNWNDVSQRINLTKLKIHIDQHHTNMLKSMDQLEKLHCLSVESINSVIDFIQITSSCPQIHKLLLVGNVVKLPTYEQFPRNLIKLSLERSRLRDDPMPILGKLPNLRILRLDVDAYVGASITCTRGGFPRLESLSILYLYCLEQWRVHGIALSKLRYLKIEGCNNLQTIPRILRQSSTLKEIVIQWMPRDFKETILGYHGSNLVGPSLVFLNMSDSDFSGGSTSAVSEVSRGAISDVEP